MNKKRRRGEMLHVWLSSKHAYPVNMEDSAVGERYSILKLTLSLLTWLCRSFTKPDVFSERRNKGEIRDSS